jgi:hypothetical protein
MGEYVLDETAGVISMNKSFSFSPKNSKKTVYTYSYRLIKIHYTKNGVNKKKNIFF